MTANGDISEGTVINLRSVKFGDAVLNNVKASVVKSQTAPLLLGQSVLERLGKIEIDNTKKVLRVTYKEKK
jgi:predicted aspartyl protease